MLLTETEQVTRTETRYTSVAHLSLNVRSVATRRLSMSRTCLQLIRSFRPNTAVAPHLGDTPGLRTFIESARLIGEILCERPPSSELWTHPTFS